MNGITSPSREAAVDDDPTEDEEEDDGCGEMATRNDGKDLLEVVSSV